MTHNTRVDPIVDPGADVHRAGRAWTRRVYSVRNRRIPDPITAAMTRYYRERYAGHPGVFVAGVVIMVVALLALK